MSPHPFSPANCIRPTLTTAVTVYGWSAPHRHAFFIGSLSMIVEVIWWMPKFFTWAFNGWPQPWDIQGRRFARVAAGVLGLAAYPVNFVRCVTAAGALAWWAIGYPIKLVNVQRWERRKALRLVRKGEAMIEHGTAPSHVIGGHALRARAVQAYQAVRSLGLGRAEPAAPPSPAPPPAQAAGPAPEAVWVLDPEMNVARWEPVNQEAAR